MDKWLAEIGLSGRALQSAIKSCDDNFVENLDQLRTLVEEAKEQFREIFPQGMIRAQIVKALASEEHNEIEEKAIEQTEAKIDDAADSRYSFNPSI